MPIRECLMLVKESAYGTPKASPVLGTDKFYIRLDQDNGFTVRHKPKRWQIGSGGGVPTQALAGQDEYETKGDLTTQLYMEQFAFLLAACGVPVSADQATPWTTTEPPGDLASFSAYYAFRRDDGSYKRRRIAGVKVASWGLDCSRADPIAKLKMSLVAQKALSNSVESTSADPLPAEFPIPGVDGGLTEAQAFPINPFVFSNSAANVGIGGTSASPLIRIQYETLSLAVENALDPKCYVSRFPVNCRFLGRTKSTLKAKLNLLNNNDRDLFESTSTLFASVAFQQLIGGNSKGFTIGLGGNNYYDDMQDDFKSKNIYMYDLTVMNQRDASTGNDLIFTLTP